MKGFVSIILITIIVFAIAMGFIAVKFNSYPLTRILDMEKALLWRFWK